MKSKLKRKYWLDKNLTVTDVITASHYSVDRSATIFEEPSIIGGDLTISVRLSTGKRCVWKPNDATLTRLKEAYGDNPKQWKDKSFLIKAQGDVINGYPWTHNMKIE